MLAELLSFLEADNEAGFISKAVELKETKDGAQKLWNQYHKGKNTTNNNTVNSGGGFIKNLAKSFIQSQEIQPFGAKQQEQAKIADLDNIFYDAKGKLNGVKEIGVQVFKTAFDSMDTFWSNQSALLTQINTKTGLTGKLSRDFRQEMTDAWPALNKIGIGMGELGEAAIQLVTQSGKFAMINKTTWEEAGKAAIAYVGSLSDLVGMFPEFQKIGLGAKDTVNAIEKVGQDSLELGLSSQKITKELASKIGLLNTYGFKNGIQGLAEMTRKSVEFRMSLDDITKIADKVWSPEGAINLSANLQVLGGAIGDFNDPLKLMYMATNNVEGLQDALIKASSSLATYNREQGRFEVTGINLRRAKEMADQFGVSMKDLTDGAVAFQERTSAMADLSGLKIDEKDKEFLTNIAQMENGKMTIELAQSPELKRQFGENAKVTLDSLDELQTKQILEYREEFKKLKPDEIIRNQATSVANIERDIDFMVAVQKTSLGKGGQQLADIIGVKDFAKYFDDFTKKHGDKGILEQIKSFANSDKEVMGKLNPAVSNPPPPKPKEETSAGNNQNQQNNGSVTRIEIKHDIMGPVAADIIKSELLRDPRYVHSFVNSLSDSSSFTNNGY